MLSAAIDFGARRTKLAMYDRRRQSVVVAVCIPTLIYVPRSGPILAGEAAREAIKSDPSGSIDDLKSRLLNGACLRNRRQSQPAELVSLLFTELRNHALEQVVKGDRLTACKVLVPLRFAMQQTELLKHAAVSAGFETVDVIEESLAAIRHFELPDPILEDTAVLCDLGSNTRLSLLRRVDSIWRTSFEIVPPIDFPQAEDGLSNVACDSLLQLQSKLSEVGIIKPPLLLVGGGALDDGLPTQISREGWGGEIRIVENAEFAGVLGAAERPGNASDIVCPECGFFPVSQKSKRCGNCGYPMRLIPQVLIPQLSTGRADGCDITFDTKSCPECMAIHPQSAATCAKCGFPFLKIR